MDSSRGQPKNVLRILTECGSEEIHYPVLYEEIPEEYRSVVEETLGETAANKENGLRRLKDFMKRENLSAPDDTLLMVLRACKYNIKKSESKLKRFLRLRRNIVEKLCRLEEHKIDLILDDMNFSILPYRDKYGRTVITSRPSLRLDKYTAEDIVPLALSTFLYLLNFPMTVVCGVSYIGEGKCDSILIYYPILKTFRTYINAMFDLPIRLGRWDIMNENYLIGLSYKAIRPILPEKFTKRVNFQGSSYKSLHSVYHPDMLPKDFEGNMEPLNDKFYRDRLENFIKKLREGGRKEN